MLPKEQFATNIAAASSYITMYRELRQLKKLGARGSLDAANRYLLWLPRGAVVAALSSLDAYVHQVLYRRIPDILRDPDHHVSDALASLISRVMPVKNPESARNALGFVRAGDGPDLLAKSIVDEVLQYATYQAPEKVIAAYQVVSFDDVFEEVAAAWPGPNITAQEIKRRLALYATRRNQIAHEGDLNAKHRPRPITPDYAAQCIDYIKKLVTRLDALD